MSSDVADEAICEKKTDKKILRHAQESWVYPLVSFFMNLMGPLAFISFIPQVIGGYCLVKTYINIKSGETGLVKHVIPGTLLTVLVLSTYGLFFYAMFTSR